MGSTPIFSTSSPKVAPEIFCKILCFQTGHKSSSNILLLQHFLIIEHFCSWYDWKPNVYQRVEPSVVHSSISLLQAVITFIEADDHHGLDET